MAKFIGKYQIVKNEKFFEHLVALGVPEDKAKEGDAAKSTLEIKVDGKKITITTESTVFNFSITLIADQEVEESTPLGVFKSTAKLSDDTMTISSVATDGKKGTRVYKVSGTELVLTITVDDPKCPQAKRFYKKL